MSRKINRLSELFIIRKNLRPGYYADGAGLVLQVGRTGSKSWLFRYMRDKKPHEMGLGALHTISLAEARQRALEARKLLLDDTDPIAAREARRAQERLLAARSKTFEVCAVAYIAAHRKEWRSEAHAREWTDTLTKYCYPVIGPLPVQAIDDTLVLRVLRPIWDDRYVTASRLRGRIENILDYARVMGYRSGENPARWKGHLKHTLPTIKQSVRVKHHPAMPFEQMFSFMQALREQQGISARALELLILTATRRDETRCAQFKEFDLPKGVWTIPAPRTKLHREHRVPLSPQALQLLEALPREGEYVFPGSRAKGPIAKNVMLALLKSMGHRDVNVHGFRSTFRSWAASTSFPREIAELCLAHQVGSEVERAYQRNEVIDKRRALLRAWADHCDHRPGAKVIPMRA